MTINSSLKNINSKTHVFFSIFFMLCIIILLIYSFYQFNINKFQPKYDEEDTFLNQKNIENRYHVKYQVSFIILNTFLLLFKNLFFLTLLFYSFLYSHVISKSDLITSDGKNIMFFQIVTHGLIILVFLTMFHILSNNYLIPNFEKKLKLQRSNTLETMIYLENGNKNYFKFDKKNKNTIDYYNTALTYYEQYASIITEDEQVNDRIRKIKNTLLGEAFDKMQKSKEDEELKNSIDNKNIQEEYYYSDYADYFYQHRDYYTALYYYQYVAESDSSKRKEALDKIDKIKRILEYENSIKSEKDKKSINELMDMINQAEIQNQKIYNQKKTAKKLVENKQYHEAYFIYTDILKTNPNLRDIIEEKKNVENELSKLSVELSEVLRAKTYPRNDNFVFMSDKNTIVNIKSISRSSGIFYLFDIKIINFDENFNINNIMYAKYGKSIEPFKITLYCYSKNDRNLEYKPLLYAKGIKEPEKISNYFYDIPLNMDTLYDFSYDYEKIYNFSVFKLVKLRKLLIGKPDISDFTYGYNVDFIETAIVDRIAHIFLFFSLSLIIIGIAWRLRTSYIGRIPLLHFILMLGIPVFLFFFVNIINIITTSYFSMLLSILDFFIVLVICAVMNIVLMVFSILYIASCKT